MNARNAQIPTPSTGGIVFSDAEAPPPEALRRLYCEDHDLFSPHELARLRFLRWLVPAERIVA